MSFSGPNIGKPFFMESDLSVNNIREIIDFDLKEKTILEGKVKDSHIELSLIGNGGRDNVYPEIWLYLTEDKDTGKTLIKGQIKLQLYFVLLLSAVVLFWCYQLFFIQVIGMPMWIPFLFMTIAVVSLSFIYWSRIDNTKDAIEELLYKRSALILKEIQFLKVLPELKKPLDSFMYYRYKATLETTLSEEEIYTRLNTLKELTADTLEGTVGGGGFKLKRSVSRKGTRIGILMKGNILSKGDKTLIGVTLQPTWQTLLSVLFFSIVFLVIGNFFVGVGEDLNWLFGLIFVYLLITTAFGFFREIRRSSYELVRKLILALDATIQ